MNKSKRKIGKIDFKKSIKNTAIAVGTGAAVQVLTEAVLPDDPQMQDIGLVILGAALPELVKMPEAETASAAMIGIAAFRYAKREDLAGKLGITTAPTTNGYDDTKAVGKGWTPVKTQFAKNAKTNVSGAKEDDAVR